MSDPAFVYVIYIRTTPEALWHALTDPDLREKYWFGRRSHSDWKTGSRHELRAPDGSLDFQGEVLESDPPRRLRYSFETASPTTTVTYELEPVEGSVRLTVIHDGFPDNSEQRKGVSKGWPSILSALKSLLETGEATPQVSG
ncbi:MAG: SRPBCC family protein [Caulobacter sp.]|jgi:uncharacterized protein YndB with AHSA1/START domain